MADIKKVVVLLPEGKLFDRLFSETIGPAISGSDLSVERVNAEFSSKGDLGRICNTIEHADLVIADLTGKNPNIMYQAGYAHGTGRKVLLITQHLEDFPFDRKAHAVIGYSGDHEFLKSELSAYLTHGPSAKPSDRGSASVNVREKFHSIFGDILASHKHQHRGAIEMENPTTFVLLNQDMDLALVQDLARRARELGLRIKLM